VAKEERQAQEQARFEQEQKQPQQKQRHARRRQWLVAEAFQVTGAAWNLNAAAHPKRAFYPHGRSLHHNKPRMSEPPRKGDYNFDLSLTFTPPPRPSGDGAA
jgi:hypothetical protein